MQLVALCLERMAFEINRVIGALIIMSAVLSGFSLGWPVANMVSSSQGLSPVVDL